MSEGFDSGAAKSAFSRPDRLMAVFGALVTIPLCAAGWSAIVDGEHTTRGVYAVVVGLLFGLLAGSFHWWKTRINPTITRAAARFSGLWVTTATVLIFVFFAGPDIYRRSVLPPPPIPTANAIATAVVKAMGTGGPPIIQSKSAELSAVQAERDQARSQLTAAQNQVRGLESQLNTLQQRSLPQPIPKPTPPKKFYSQKQKDEIADMIQALTALVTQRSSAIMSEAEKAGIPSASSIGFGRGMMLSQQDSKERVDNIFNSVTDIQKASRLYESDLRSFAQAHSYYAEELSFIVLNQMMVDDLNGVSNAADYLLRVYRDDPINIEIKKYPTDAVLYDILLRLMGDPMNMIGKRLDVLQTSTQEIKARAAILLASLDQTR